MKINIRQPKCFSEIGRKDNQEDYLWPQPQTVSSRNHVFLMCDGVGGQDKGEVASETAATALGTYLTEHQPKDGEVTKALFEEALAYAYDALDKVDTAGEGKMATTMTCLVLHSGGALVAHIGDSRVYHIRPSLADEEGRSGIIYQSADHSLVNDLLRAGELTEEEAAVYPHKNIITRAMQPHLERRYKADIYNISDVQPGDYFFLCSDGVLEQLSNDMLGAILSDDTLDDEGMIQAIKQVCDGRTRDNNTCWLIPVDSVEGAIAPDDSDDVVGTVVEAGERNTGGGNPAPLKDNSQPLIVKVISIAAVCVCLAVVGWFVSDMFSGGKAPAEQQQTVAIESQNTQQGPGNKGSDANPHQKPDTAKQKVASPAPTQPATASPTSASQTSQETRKNILEKLKATTAKAAKEKGAAKDGKEGKKEDAKNPKEKPASTSEEK